MVAAEAVAFVAAVAVQDLQRLELVLKAPRGEVALPPAAESAACPRAVEACESHDADG